MEDVVSNNKQLEIFGRILLLPWAFFAMRKVVYHPTFQLFIAVILLSQIIKTFTEILMGTAPPPDIVVEAQGEK